MGEKHEEFSCQYQKFLSKTKNISEMRYTNECWSYVYSKSDFQSKVWILYLYALTLNRKKFVVWGDIMTQIRTLKTFLLTPALAKATSKI